MIPEFFTATLFGGRATTRINACAISRLSTAHDEGCMIYLQGGDSVRVNHSVLEVENMIGALRPQTRIEPRVEIRAVPEPRGPRRKTA
ncbi:MAG: hypothetical protein P4L68_08190 [Methylovirgula sp.]|nr:hypothetical protein [Methylovirgula sp.]